MVRLADLPEWERQHMLDKLKELSGFDLRPWVKGGRSAADDASALQQEIAGFAPWHDLAVQRRGRTTAAYQAHEWFWRETVAGRVLPGLRKVCPGHADASVHGFGSSNLVPRAILHTPETATRT